MAGIVRRRGVTSDPKESLERPLVFWLRFGHGPGDAQKRGYRPRASGAGRSAFRPPLLRQAVWEPRRGLGHLGLVGRGSGTLRILDYYQLSTLQSAVGYGRFALDRGGGFPSIARV